MSRQKVGITGLDGKPIDLEYDLDHDNLVDRDIASYLRVGQLPEPETIHAMLRFVRPGDVVVDGGANNGFFTVLLSKLVGPAGKVVAVEPDERNLRKLARNLAVNECENVDVVPFALSDKVGRAELYTFEHGGASTCVRVPAIPFAGHVVEATTLDAIFKTRSKIPSFIKLDIEGYEYKALRGAQHILSIDHIPCVVEWNYHHVQTLELLREWMGSSMFRLDNHGGVPTMIPRASKIVSHVENKNVLFTLLERVGEVWPEVLL